MMDLFNYIFYDERYKILNMRGWCNSYVNEQSPNIIIPSEIVVDDEEQAFIDFMNQRDRKLATLHCLRKYTNIPMTTNNLAWFNYIKNKGVVRWDKIPCSLNASERFEDFDQLTQGFLFNNLSKYTKIFRALTEDYDPLQNYYGDEKRETKRTPNLLDTTTNGQRVTETKNNEAKDKTEYLQGTHTSTLQNTTNSDTAFRNKEKTEDTQTGKDVTDITTGERLAQVTAKQSEDMVKHTGHEDFIDTFHREGNLGVTSSQDMLQQEIDVRKANNLVAMICEDFIEECCFPYPTYKGVSLSSLFGEYVLE